MAFAVQATRPVKNRITAKTLKRFSRKYSRIPMPGQGENRHSQVWVFGVSFAELNARTGRDLRLVLQVTPYRKMRTVPARMPTRPIDVDVIQSAFRAV